MASFAFNVRLNGRLIDTVFYSVNSKTKTVDAVDDVRRSLIEHDGYDSNIVVNFRSGQRRTVDVYELRKNYGHGFECVTAEHSAKEIRQRRREYQENEGGYFRIVKTREYK